MNQNLSESSKFIERLDKIICNSFDLLEMKIANGGVISKNEASFQLELGYILKTVGQLYEFHPKEKFNLEFERRMNLLHSNPKNNSKNSRVDIYTTFGTEEKYASAAIELKFPKKSNQREPNTRYEIVLDLWLLESYKDSYTDIGYFYICTDHPHYVNKKSYSPDTKDFDVRNGSEYVSGTTLEYRTDKPHGNPISLNGNYQFQWRKIEDLYFMTTKI